MLCGELGEFCVWPWDPEEGTDGCPLGERPRKEERLVPFEAGHMTVIGWKSGLDNGRLNNGVPLPIPA